MYYAQMRKFDIANGIGIRATLFVSGCTHNCKGCFNRDYADFGYGNRWDSKAKELFLEYCREPMVHGVTILGGEPFDQINDQDLEELLHTIKEETAHDIWIYSGYTFEQILKDDKKRKLLEICDVLVDGPFVEALKDLNLRFRGSSNQRIIDIYESLQKGQVVLKDME